MTSDGYKPELLCDIWFPGKPRGKGRQNFMARPRRKGAGVSVGSQVLYALKDIGCFPTTTTTAKYEQDLQVAIIQQMRKQGHFTAYDGPVELKFCAFYQPVKSDTGKSIRGKLRGEIPKSSTPDCDNIEKMICDAANKYVFLDDAQVIQTQGCKVYSDKEGIRMRFYKTHGAYAINWAKEEFNWEKEEFRLAP